MLLRQDQIAIIKQLLSSKKET